MSARTGCPAISLGVACFVYCLIHASLGVNGWIVVVVGLVVPPSCCGAGDRFCIQLPSEGKAYPRDLTSEHSLSTTTYCLGCLFPWLEQALACQVRQKTPVKMSGIYALLLARLRTRRSAATYQTEFSDPQVRQAPQKPLMCLNLRWDRQRSPVPSRDFFAAREKWPGVLARNDPSGGGVEFRVWGRQVSRHRSFSLARANAPAT